MNDEQTATPGARATAPTPDPTAATAQTDPTAEQTGPDLETLVGAWLTYPDVAERLGIPVTAVRRLVEDRELLSARVGERRILSVPEAFLRDGEADPYLRGTFVVLADGGMDDQEILGWLFTPDDTLPVPGTPMDALRAGFKTEVRRRAMETAW